MRSLPPRLPVLASLLCALLALVAGPGTAREARAEETSTIVQITLHPNAAVLEERVQAPVQSTAQGPAVTFSLPRGAELQGLKVASLTPGLAVTGVTWQEAPGADTPRVTELRRRLAQAVAARDAAKAEAGALAAQADFWRELRTQAASGTTPEGAARLAAAVGTNLGPLLERLYAAQAGLEEKEKAVKAARDALDDATGKERSVWQVRVGLSGDAQKAELALAYAVSGCGWSPAYRLNALPGANAVEISFEAVVRQSTGRTWNAPLRLATVPPLVRLDPPALRPWIIAPWQEPTPRPMAAQRAFKAANADTAAEMAAPAPAPREDYGAFAAYDLGRRVVEPGEPVRLPVRAEKAKAEFVHLLRPSEGPESYLKAALTLEGTARLPEGPALFQVDGAMVGEGNFAVQGSTADVFFGTDPLVRCTATLENKGSGESGIFKKSQTYVWKWHLVAENKRDAPVRAVLEEPLPVARDARIELTTTAAPEPTRREKGTVVWELTLPAKGTSAVDWQVSLSAPPEMRLDLGGR
ncbi:Conserved hypothetical protein CHP02231 [Desulfovibrio sp. X2]|uniref:DUF4139 domain-containing protein n=1 Tax=Desulfovibrio sp. X2 TaxID=941449 RepID=UPI0003589BDB|nr:DUF4139 domain-containing protein [Desulfovibrio sp. X2]EPR37441.1 Conserved hypothetical protein CHP02231 [Desulfovibrio sp. X2]